MSEHLQNLSHWLVRASTESRNIDRIEPLLNAMWAILYHLEAEATRETPSSSQDTERREDQSFTPPISLPMFYLARAATNGEPEIMGTVTLAERNSHFNPGDVLRLFQDKALILLSPSMLALRSQPGSGQSVPKMPAQPQGGPTAGMLVSPEPAGIEASAARRTDD